MTLASLTRTDVLAAVAEFDNLGRGQFLRVYGFSKAKSYFLELDGSLYDSKAIVGRALELTAKDFSGGDETVARRLKDLGFEVRYFPVLPWKAEEIVLACAVVEANGWRQPSGQTRDWRIVELSELLQTSHFHPAAQHGPDFRNPAGVGRKMADIATQHPDYRGKPTRGNRLDREVVMAFLERPKEMHAEAARLRALLLEQPNPSLSSEPQPQPAAGEPIVRDVPVEGHRTDTFATGSRAERVTATRREAQMMKRYQAAMARAGHPVTGKLIFLPGRPKPLRIDLFDSSRAELIEAKGSSERDYVRFALGQVLDYARYVEHKHRAVLLPALPDGDLLNLLLDHGIHCIYEAAEEVFERVDARS